METLLRDHPVAETADDMRRMVEIVMTGRRDPEFEANVHAEAMRLREETYRSQGLLDIGVALIREARDE